MSQHIISLSYHRSPSPIPPIPLRSSRHSPSSSPSSSPSPSPVPHVSFPSIADPPGTVPIPWSSLFPILLICCADAMTYSVLFPFVTDMITSFRVAPDKIGLYSGLGEGVMMLVEAANATNWAKAGNKYGRRPCIILGFTVTVMAMPMLAFSGRVWQLVVARAIMGLNPSGVLVKTSAAELAHPTNRDRIFSILSPSFSCGFLLGTFLGGELAHPYGRLPWWLGGTSEVWRRWPYALPCLVVCVCDVLATLVAYLYLPETQRFSEKPQQKTKARSKSEILQTFKVPTFGLVVAVTCLFQVCYFNWDGIFTVFTYTSTDKGGLGLPVDIIGLLYSAASLISIISNPLFLPKLQSHLGPRRALGIVLLSWPTLSLCVPLAQWTAVHARWAMWVVMVLMMCLRTFGNFAWAMTDIMTMAAFDNYPELMATGNAISLIASAGGRAFGPAISGWIYSISTQFPTGSLGRQSSWIYLFLMTIPGVILVRFLRRDSKQTSDNEGYEAVPLVESAETSATRFNFEENGDAVER